MSEYFASNLRDYAVSLDKNYNAATKLKMRQHAVALYGEDAMTAVAYCALAAWCECQQNEYQFWSELFNQMHSGDQLH